MEIGHFGIYADDVEAFTNWYSETLGLEEIERIDSKIGLVTFLKAEEGDSTIEILPTTGERKERELRDAGFSHIAFLVEDFDKYAKRLKSKGVKLWGVRDTVKGWKIGYFEDLEGNILELQQR